jgi:acylphosphatase
MQRRITCFVSGRVQGVGYRQHTKEIAKRFRVTGTVENLPDRRVKIVAEGELDEVNLFLDKVVETTMGNVTHHERFESEASTEFPGFSVLW